MGDFLKKSLNILIDISKNPGETEEVRNNLRKLAQFLNEIWEKIDSIRGKISDLTINKLYENLTKLTVAVDAFLSGMISYSSLKNYLVKEELYHKLTHIVEKYL